MNNCELGKIGEDAVADFVSRQGHCILERNYWSNHGEIDLIFMEDKCLVFAEVKTRKNINYGLPCQAVDINKRNKIINTARFYLACKGLSDLNVRFDVFEVYYRDRKIRQIKSAYEIR